VFIFTHCHHIFSISINHPFEDLEVLDVCLGKHELALLLFVIFVFGFDLAVLEAILDLLAIP